jgi:ribosomal protein S18 acetylase RimI-like enzyme
MPANPATAESAEFAASQLQLVAADACPEADLHQAFRAAFADYLIGPFEVPRVQWPTFLARQGVDLSLSRVALGAHGQPLAFALVAARPTHRRWRLATMGARPEARGTGAAAALLDDFILRAGQAGQQAVELEVFAQNERARRLYKSRGFETVHVLHGWQAPLMTLGQPTGPGPLPDPAAHAGENQHPVHPAPHAVDMSTALNWLDEAERRWPDLPLQVTQASLQPLAEPHAWQCGQAQVVFTLPDETVMVNSFIAPDTRDAARLIQALATVYPQRRLRVPQLQRDDLGGQALRQLGAQPLPLHQLWMLRST